MEYAVKADLLYVVVVVAVVESQSGFGHDGGKSSVQWDKHW